MKKVFEMPSIQMESFQTAETVMTEETNPWELMSVTFEF